MTQLYHIGARVERLDNYDNCADKETIRPGSLGVVVSRQSIGGITAESDQVGIHIEWDQDSIERVYLEKDIVGKIRVLKNEHTVTFNMFDRYLRVSNAT
jgi:hypothetical protein